MYFVLTQRDGKYGYSTVERGWYFGVFSVHMTCVCPFTFTFIVYDSPSYYSNYGMMISFMAYKIFKSQYLFHT